MEKLLERLSAYQVISSLIPGAAFLIFLQMIDYPIDLSNVWTTIVMSYLIGLFFNRVGGLVLRGIEPDEMKRLYRIYRDEPQAQAIYDTFVMYRTIVVAVIFAIGALAAKTIPCPVLANGAWLELAALLAFAITFFFAWRLQAHYVHARLEGNVPEKRAE